MHRGAPITMRKLLLLIIFCGLLCAQSSSGPFAITSTQCAPIAPGANATVYLQVTGTWTGTLQPKASIAGQPTFNVQVVPSNSTVPQSTITANGGYSTTVAGYSYFAVCGASVSAGTATVNLNAAPKHR